jgi:hypothetical protein
LKLRSEEVQKGTGRDAALYGSKQKKNKFHLLGFLGNSLSSFQ